MWGFLKKITLQSERMDKSSWKKMCKETKPEYLRHRIIRSNSNIVYLKIMWKQKLFYKIFVSINLAMISREHETNRNHKASQNKTVIMTEKPKILVKLELKKQYYSSSIALWVTYHCSWNLAQSSCSAKQGWDIDGIGHSPQRRFRFDQGKNSFLF